MMGELVGMRRVMIAAGLLGIAIAPAQAHDWRSVTKANYGEFSVDLKGATWARRVVTYQTLYQIAHPRARLDHTISTSKIDCQTRRRTGVYATEYYRDGKKHGGSINGGWRPIYPGSASDQIRHMLCGAD
ncbi:MAG: surface-adhesin E family protein [Sphingomicrobium sp.]